MTTPEIAKELDNIKRSKASIDDKLMNLTALRIRLVSLMEKRGHKFTV